MNPDGDVFIHGHPLPPMPGPRYVEAGGIAIPGGFTTTPALRSAVLRKTLRLANGDLAVLEIDGTFERIQADGFVKATRAAARLSREPARHE
jgi:hypothetical protein